MMGAKKVILTSTIFLFTLFSHAQIRIYELRLGYNWESFVGFSVYYNGYWGNWELYDARIYGNYSSIAFYHPLDHPSKWTHKFTIDNYSTPSKKEIKEHWKKKIAYEYQGTFEYYITDYYPSIKKIFESWNYPCVFPSQHNTEKGDMPCVKRTVPAKIKILPYKDHPRVYNIWFEDVGFAINLCKYSFEQK